jgi:OOP family OmpA-OmpF porin
LLPSQSSHEYGIARALPARDDGGVTRTTRLLAAALLAPGGLVAASQAPAQGFYIGASAGNSSFDSDITTGLITSGTVDKKSSGYKLFAGYEFSQHFGVEIAYVDLGKASYSGYYYGVPVTGGKVEVWGLNLSAVGTLPLNSTFAVFGKVGLFAWEAKSKDTTGGFPFSDTVSGGDFSFGAGLRVRFLKNFSAHVEWERFGLTGYDYDLGNADMLSVGIAYKF